MNAKTAKLIRRYVTANNPTAEARGHKIVISYRQAKRAWNITPRTLRATARHEMQASL